MIQRNPKQSSFIRDDMLSHDINSCKALVQNSMNLFVVVAVVSPFNSVLKKILTVFNKLLFIYFESHPIRGIFTITISPKHKSTL